MRMTELKLNSGRLVADVSKLPETCIIVLSQGKAKIAKLAPFAETKVITDQGKVTRVKFDEAERF